MEAIHAKVATIRPLAYFPADMWGDSFVTFSPEDISEMETYKIQIEPLKQEVQMMVLDKSIDLEKKMILIDAVERLGISYHYENEIEHLSNTASQFRVFRQHGYKMPCDVFNKFTGIDSKKLKETRDDIKGIVSLYEAAHLRVHGESILEELEALAYTTNVLKTSGAKSKQSRYALNQVVYRLETRHFISLYKKDED